MTSPRQDGAAKDAGGEKKSTSFPDLVRQKYKSD
jgi:hypothetical protein